MMTVEPPPVSTMLAHPIETAAMAAARTIVLRGLNRATSTERTSWRGTPIREVVTGPPVPELPETMESLITLGLRRVRVDPSDVVTRIEDGLSAAISRSGLTAVDCQVLHPARSAGSTRAAAVREAMAVSLMVSMMSV